jgi:methionyl-tRNA formyltransferase
VLRQRVLALEGWPGSTFDHRGVTIKVGATQSEDSSAPGAPGLILAADRSGVRISCGQGVLVLTQLQRPGGKMLPAGEFLAGFPLSVGETLASAEMPAFVASAPFPRAPKA